MTQNEIEILQEEEALAWAILAHREYIRAEKEAEKGMTYSEHLAAEWETYDLSEVGQLHKWVAIRDVMKKLGISSNFRHPYYQEAKDWQTLIVKLFQKGE